MTNFQMLGNSFLRIWPGIDLVLFFDPKVHLFENSFLKILAQQY